MGSHHHAVSLLRNGGGFQQQLQAVVGCVRGQSRSKSASQRYQRGERGSLPRGHFVAGRDLLNSRCAERL